MKLQSPYLTTNPRVKYFVYNLTLFGLICVIGLGCSPSETPGENARANLYKSMGELTSSLASDVFCVSPIEKTATGIDVIKCTYVVVATPIQRAYFEEYCEIKIKGNCYPKHRAFPNGKDGEIDVESSHAGVSPADQGKVAQSPKAEDMKSIGLKCYDVGYRFGHTATSLIKSKKVNPSWNVPIPERCLNDPETDKGILAGTRAVG